MDLKRAVVDAKDSCQEMTDSCKEMSDSCHELTDSCQELADSYKSLQAMAADLLSSWEQFKSQQAAVTSSPSTTTTPPPTAPAPPPATPEEAPANKESEMNRPLKLHVVPELCMPVPAKCSTKCQDVLHKQCMVTSVPLSSTDVFTMVQKAAVLPPKEAPTNIESAVDHPLQLPVVPELAMPAPAKCSTECLVNVVVDNTKLDEVVSHEIVEVVALPMANTISVDPGDHRQPPWPPPQIYKIRLSCWGISSRSQFELKLWLGELQYQCTRVKHTWPPLCKNSSPHELQKIFGQAASFDSQHCSSNGPRGTIIAASVSRMLQISVHWSSMRKAFQIRGVLIHWSWWRLNTWSPIVLMVYTYWLLQEHVFIGVEVLDMQLLGWSDIAVFSGCNTFVSEYVFTTFQQLNLYQCRLNQAVATHLRANPMELFTGDAASIWCGCTESQCINIGRPNYRHCSARSYPSGEDYCFLWASEHVTRFSWELIHLVMATCHGNFVTNEKVTIALFISLKELLGLQLFVLALLIRLVAPWNPGEQNTVSPCLYMVSAYESSTFHGGDNAMAQTTYYLDVVLNTIRINRGYYEDQVIDSWPSSVIDSEKNVSNRQKGSYGILDSWTLASQFTRLQRTWKKAVQKLLAGQSTSFARGTTEPILTFDVSAVISPCRTLFILVYIHHFLMENWIPALSTTCCFCLLPGAAKQWTKVQKGAADWCSGCSITTLAHTIAIAAWGLGLSQENVSTAQQSLHRKSDMVGCMVSSPINTSWDPGAQIGQTAPAVVPFQPALAFWTTPDDVVGSWWFHIDTRLEGKPKFKERGMSRTAPPDGPWWRGLASGPNLAWMATT